MKVNEERGKASLKLNIQKTKITASSSITSWQTEGRKVETGMYFIFLGSKMTADSDCSHEIKRHFLPGRKPMTNRQHIRKQRQHFANKVLYNQTMVFPLVICRCESWITKQTEPQRIDAFELSCWRRLLRVP